jgi:hypothetical protein
MTRHPTNALFISRSRRRGLAPLEFVLALPMLVVMMALMIDFGFAGAWKIRTQTNARYAGWRTLTVRTGEANATPPYWSASAPLTAQGGSPLPEVSNDWDATNDLLCPCARGHALTAPAAIASINVPGRLEMDDDIIRGNADLTRTMPLLRGALPATQGRFRFNLNQDLFDNHWQFHSLGIAWNDSPRSRVWWDIEHSDLTALEPAIDQNKQLLDTNHQLLTTNPNQADLYPLDNDDEFIRYTGSAPEFHPRIGRICMSDPQVLYLSAISRVDQDGHSNPNSLLSRIDRLPCTMSSSFTSMYRSWICELEQCGFNDGDIDPLRQRYGDLQQFMGTLGSLGCSRPPNLQRCVCPPMSFCPCPPSPVGVGR